MLFSLFNAPTTFQNYINKALGNLVDTIYIVYLNNILIYLKDKSKYVKYIKQMLKRLCTQGLYTKLFKYSFHTKLVKFFSYFITPKGVIINPTQVKAIKEQPKPKFYKDIQVFLSFTNFYRQFIWNYLDIIHPLNVYIAQIQHNLILKKIKEK